MVVHQRDAAPDVFERLIPWAASRSNPGVLHAFSGGAALAEQAASAGFFLGLAGPITYPKADELRTVARLLPRHRVVLETDSPYLTPHPMPRSAKRARRVLTLVADALGAVWGQAPEPVRRAAWDNAQALFQWNDGIDNRDLL